MVDQNSVQIFFRSPINEREILKSLSKYFGLIFETVDINVDGAIGFVAFNYLGDGFEQGILVSWPIGMAADWDMKNIILSLAAEFGGDVLLEAGEDEWLLAGRDGALRRVATKETENGIDIDTDV